MFWEMEDAQSANAAVEPVHGQLADDFIRLWISGAWIRIRSAWKEARIQHTHSYNLNNFNSNNNVNKLPTQTHTCRRRQTLGCCHLSMASNDPPRDPCTVFGVMEGMWLFWRDPKTSLGPEMGSRGSDLRESSVCFVRTQYVDRRP